MNIEIPRSQLTASQWRLLQSREKQVLVAGGFGSGKTTAIGLKLVQLKAENPGVPGLLMAQSWRALWSITLRRLMSTLRRILPRSELPVVRDRMGECYLDFGDGAPVFLRSAHDSSTFDGLDVGWGCGDEPRYWPKMSHEVFMGRIRVKCPRSQLCYSSTPALNWLSDEFNSGRPHRELIRAPTSENERNLGPDFIPNLRLSYSRRMQQAVIDGHFVPLEGVVYEYVDLHDPQSGWFVDHRTSSSLKTILAVDPGYRRSAWLWIQEVSPTQWVVVDQMMPDDKSDEANVQAVNDRGIPIDEVWCDPASDQTESTMSLDTITMLQQIKGRTKNGPAISYITGPYRSLSYGVDKVRTLFGDGDKQPTRLKFARSLIAQEATMAKGRTPRGILRDVMAYQYPEMKDGRSVSDDPLKDGVHDHANDALRYFGVGMWLTSPLRQLDYDLQRSTAQGFRRAA